MKNILAENMRRFRTKNLNEQTATAGNVTQVPVDSNYSQSDVPPLNNTPASPPAPDRITKLTDIKNGDKFNLFKDAGGVTPLYTGTIVDAMKLKAINDGRVLFDINIQGVGTKTIGWSASYTASGPQKNPNANQFLLFNNNNDAHAWYNGDVKPAGLLNKVITGNPVIKGSTLVYNDKLGKLLKAHHGQASYDPTAAN
jgi:hypothetical protein